MPTPSSRWRVLLSDALGYFEIGPQDDRRSHLVDGALGSALSALVASAFAGCTGQEAFCLHRRPAFVEGVDWNASRFAQFGREARCLVGFGATSTVHVQWKADDGATDLAFSDHRAERRDVTLASTAFEDARRKRNLAPFVRDGEADPLAAEVDA